MHEVSALTCNESMHHDKSAHSFTCIEGAGNVHIAKRYAHANVNTERARSNVGMYDGRARIDVTSQPLYVHLYSALVTYLLLRDACTMRGLVAM
jgi:hypothetical protein